MFYAYAAFLALPIATLTEAADAIVRGYVAAGRVTRVLALRPDVVAAAIPAPEPPSGASLHDPLSGLTVRPGEFLGVAADSPDDAAGLADRLGRYVIQDGPGPELGGTPLTDLAVDTVRSRILVAATNAHLFSGPLAQSLADAAPGSCDEDALEAAVQTASAQDVLEALPGGLHGYLDARGSSLSGGQAQRVRLARALLADPEILVLVEPTSSVDAHTEARIARGLRAHRAGRTTIVMSTSPLILDATDRVVHLREGKVAAEGSHHELLTASAAYADVVTRGEDL
jgi:ABC-type multidrug transport system fused ATPase/permease subunit